MQIMLELLYKIYIMKFSIDLVQHFANLFFTQ